MEHSAKSTLEKIFGPDNINTVWSAIKHFYNREKISRRANRRTEKSILFIGKTEINRDHENIQH